jgi:hypothetical protein
MATIDFGIYSYNLRRELILSKGYKDESLPSEETIRRKLNEIGYTLKRVAKTKPQKRIAETDAIFKQVKKINQEADANPHILRISIIGADTQPISVRSTLNAAG